MNLELINSIACGMIALWAFWCVVSGKVRDGILGKLIYSTIAISAYVVTTRHDSFLFGPTTAGLTLHIALALAGIRHLFMVTYWRRVKAWICRHLNCERCMGCEKKR
ncbi:hypothetical protein [Pseudomonas alvandae]|uniref:hypothetical protein n=1 Tax=Pseudomonas canavaninivorans TaxID=2842348 RepID=UPI003D661173